MAGTTCSVLFPVDVPSLFSPRVSVRMFCKFLYICCRDMVLTFYIGWISMPSVMFNPVLVPVSECGIYFI